MTDSTLSVSSLSSIPHAGVFTGNKEKPIHRWYPYIEGYSAGLVKWALDNALVDRPKLLDPFGGSGTTSLVAAENGLDSWFCEVNPFMAWVANVKVNVVQELVNSQDLIQLNELANFVKKTGRARTKHLKYDSIVRVNSTRKYFPSGVAGQIAKSLTWIDENYEGAIRELARLAVAVSLVPVSLMVRRTDLRRRTTADPKPLRFGETVRRAVSMMVTDIKSAESFASLASLASPDVRAIQGFDSYFDLIVTSPPYLNGTNYCRNTKLELISLEFINSEDELKQFRSDSIAAGINSVSSRRESPMDLDYIKTVVQKLDKAAYDKRIPTLVRLYFSDMTVAFRQLRRVSKEGARLVLDIGDSKFAGVHVRTDELLKNCASTTGWTFEKSFPVRERRSYDGSKLAQVVLQFVAGSTDSL